MRKKKMTLLPEDYLKNMGNSNNNNNNTKKYFHKIDTFVYIFTNLFQIPSKFP